MPALSPNANTDAQPRASRSRKAEQLAEARDENTSAERLDALARKGGDVALAVAANPCTHPDTLDRLSRNVRRSVRAAVACNPNASMDCLVRCIPANPQGFLDNPALQLLLLTSPNYLNNLPHRALVSLLLNPSAPQAFLEQMITTHRNGFNAAYGHLLSRSDLSRDQVLRLCGDTPGSRHASTMHVPHVALHAEWNTDPLPDLVQHATRRRRIETTHAGRMVFRRARPLPEPMLMAILPWADEGIRLALAENPLTPARVLHWLAADPCSKVVHAAYGNPSLPQDIREAIQHQGEDLGRLFAGDPTFTGLEQLSRSRDAHIRLAVAQHPSAPERLRSRLPNATMIALRRQAILDPITSADGLMKLANEDRPEFNVLLATRSHLPEEVLNRLTKGTMSLEVEALLAGRHDLTPAQLNGIVKNPGQCKVAVALLFNPSAPASLVDWIIRTAPRDCVIEYALHADAQATYLKRIAEARTSVDVLETVAAHPNTPREVLERLGHHHCDTVRAAAASNPNLPEPLARALLRHPATAAAAALHPCLTPEERRVLAPLRHAYIERMLQHPQRFLMLQAERNSAQFRERNKGNRIGLSTDALALLASDASRCLHVSLAIASNPASPAEALQRLAETGTTEVIEAVAGHVNAPPALLEHLVPGTAAPMLCTKNLGQAPHIAAMHPSLPATAFAKAEPYLILAWLHDFSSCPLWPHMLSHPACPAAWLLRHARSNGWGHRCMVAMNPSTPLPALQRLALDGMHPVRNAARATLRSIGKPIPTQLSDINDANDQGDTHDTN